MTRPDKVLQAVLTARSDQNIRFDDLCGLLRALRFDERQKGSHRIFTLKGIDEIINLQPLPGGKAKAYQVKQVRNIITKYKLGLEL